MLKKRAAKADVVSAEVKLVEALKRMAGNGLDALLVVDGGRLSGVFTAHDYIRHSLGRLPAMDTPLAELMTACDIFARPTDSAHSGLLLMKENGLRYLPVQDQLKPIALLSLAELLEETLAYFAKIHHETELDHQIVFLRGTYSC